MKFTLSWLKRFLDTDASLEHIAHTLTMTGLEIEEIVDNSELLGAFEVAEITNATKHPDADKLKICKVNTKNGDLQIVCGASNARAGIKVVLAPVGTLIPNGNFKIKKSAIRGVESSGMMCSYEELGLNGDSSGIIELDDSAVVGDNVASYLGADDPMIYINITPNRADALGVYGIARDLAASGVGKLKELSVPEVKAEFDSNFTIDIKSTDKCTLFGIREIKNTSNVESPKWLVNYLDAIGVGSISPVVDVTNYISYSFGQPMHAYDASKIKSNLVIESLEKEVKFNALDEKEYKLQKNDLVIRDENGVQCLAGIIGGMDSACDANTTNVILEAASFDSNSVTMSGRKHGIESDSRYRFERNVDSAFTLKALDIATNLILEICGGSASNSVIDGSSSKEEKIIDFPVSYLTKKTSIELSGDEIISILSKLGFSCSLNGNIIKITVPSWRYDVTIKEDIIEEIVRIYGYDNIPMCPLPSTQVEKIVPRDQRRIADIKRLMAVSGHKEVVTWSFMDSEKAKLFADLKEELTLQNPISSDLDYMRPSILPNILGVCRNNINRSFNDLSMFEVGPIFADAGVDVINNVCGVRTGTTMAKNSHGPSRDFDVYDIKFDFAKVLEMSGLDINKCQLKKEAPSYYHPTRSVKVCLGKNILGYFGQVHPGIAKKFNIDADVFAFELSIGALPYSKDKFGKKPEYKVSNYQMIVRDYAFIVDKSIAVGEMLNFIKNTDKKLVKDVSLFDIYEGEHIEDGKKSVALSVNIQDDNKTLEEADIVAINNKIIEGVLQKFSGILRDK